MVSFVQRATLNRVPSHASPNTSRVTRKHVRLNIHSFYFILCRHKEKASAAELSERASYVRPLETVLNQWTGSWLHTGVSGLADII